MRSPDFFCAAAKLCVEIDCPAHAGEELRDARRTAFLAREGITVLRLSVEDVSNRPAMIIAAIRLAAPASHR